MTYQLKDYLYSINQSKKSILDDDVDSERGYPPYIINRCLSSFTDTVLYSNEMTVLLRVLTYAENIVSVCFKKMHESW